MAPASAGNTPGTGPQPTREATVDKVKDTGTRPRIKDRRDVASLDRRDKKEGDRLFDVLAALPFDRRIEAIERMADRMGV